MTTCILLSLKIIMCAILNIVWRDKGWCYWILINSKNGHSIIRFLSNLQTIFSYLNARNIIKHSKPAPNLWAGDCSSNRQDILSIFPLFRNMQLERIHLCSASYTGHTLYAYIRPISSFQHLPHIPYGHLYYSNLLQRNHHRHFQKFCPVLQYRW